MNKAGNVLTFTAGVAVGFLSAWFIAKKKYEERLADEIASIKEVRERKNTVILDDATNESGDDKPDLMTYYKNKISNEGYNGGYVNTPETQALKKAVNSIYGLEATKPRIISSDEFDSSDYEAISLTYCADKVLIDDDGGIIHNVDDVVGKENLHIFDGDESDVLYVINDKLKTVYEICRDVRNYSDIPSPPSI